MYMYISMEHESGGGKALGAVMNFLAEIGNFSNMDPDYKGSSIDFNPFEGKDMSEIWGMCKDFMTGDAVTSMYTTLMSDGIDGLQDAITQRIDPETGKELVLGTGTPALQKAPEVQPQGQEPGVSLDSKP